MGIHVAGTQHGHTYYLGPLEGSRGAALIALRSRAPAAHVKFWPLQHTIWQIEAGLSYNDMSTETQQLIDSLIPEYKNLLREDFLKSLQKLCSGVRGRILGSACDEIKAQIARYQQAQQTLQRYGNNYEALAQQIVHVLPGTYPTPGPASWSQLSPRVYARVAGGHIWQEPSTIEIRVLPSSGAGFVSMDRLQGATLQNASYNPNGGIDPAQTPENDMAEVPLGAVITYPDVGAGMQVLGPELEPGLGQPASPASTPAIASTAEGNPLPQPSPAPEPASNPAPPPSQAAGTTLDQDIVADINISLGQDTTLTGQDIRVSAQDGVVTLEGTVETAEQKKRVVSIAQTVKGVKLIKSRLAVSGEQPLSGGSGGGSISDVDFRNFEYHPQCMERRAAKVSNGEWKNQKEDEFEFFSVGKVIYGDLKGDGQEEAVVLGACGGGMNFQIGDLLVFSMSPAGPKLLAELSPNDWGQGQEDNGGDFAVSAIQINKQQLAVSFSAGGAHGSPEWTVTATFGWRANRLIRTGVSRKPYTDQ